MARQGEASLGVELFAMAQRVRRVVPDLIGLSLATVADGVTLTLVASTDALATVDAVQYLDGGPCVDDINTGEINDVNIGELLAEDRWQMYAQASAALGIASSLSLPIMADAGIIGGVNLYAATKDAFVGLHEPIAVAVGSDAEYAVANADLSFQTLKAAREAPDRVREGSDINIALGMISVMQHVNIPIARERLRNAATRAGVTEAQAALVLRFVRSNKTQ